MSEPIVSYSQNAEDVRLWRVFRTIENGFYVDVGAADPYVDSVTRLFYEHGWSGINVEPSPCFEALREARPRDVNLRIAIGESEGSVPFFLTYPYLGMSTVDPSVHAGVPEAIERIEEIAIPQRRLDSILREHAAGRTIHFLKVDVEGAERQVLASSRLGLLPTDRRDRRGDRVVAARPRRTRTGRASSWTPVIGSPRSTASIASMSIEGTTS